jgi:phage-related protein
MADGTELGIGHISIFPSMKGFRKQVEQEVGGAAKDSQNAFKNGFNGGAAGHKAGTDFKNGFNAASQAMAKAALDTLKSDVAKASRANTDALLKQKQAAVQVQAAQEKLASATEKYGADSVQAQAAAIRVQQAELKLKDAQDKTAASTQKLTAAETALKGLEAELAAEAAKPTTAFGRMANAFKGAADTISNRVPAVKTAITGISTTTEAMKGKVSSALSATAERFPKLAAAANGLHTVFGRIGSAAGGMASTVGEKFQSMAGTAAAHVRNLAQAAVTAIAGAVSVIAAKVVAFGKQSVEAARNAEETTAKFQQIAKNNNWSDAQQKSLLGLNKTLSQTGVVSGGVLKAAQAQLGTFALTADQVKTLTPALADLIANNKGYAATAEDGVTMANLLGKVMTGNTTALKKYGVTMTAAQEATLKNGNASEKAAMAAQVLEANFGGVNQALANTPQGKMTILQHEIAGLKVSVGNDLIEAFGGVGGAVIKMVQAVEPVITALFDRIAKIADVIGPPIEKALGTVTDKINGLTQNGLGQSLTSLAGPIAAVTGMLGMSGLGGVISALGVDKIPVLGTVLGKFGGLLGGLSSPVMLVVAALGALIATSPQLRQDFGNMLQLVFATLQQAFVQLEPSLKELGAAVMDLINTLMPVITQALDAIIPALQPIIACLINSLVPVINSLLPVVTTVINAITPIIQALTPVITTMAQTIGQVLQALVPVIQMLAGVVQVVVQAVCGFVTSTLMPTIQAIAPYVTAIVDNITQVLRGITGVVKGVVDMVAGIFSGDWRRAWNGFEEAAGGAWNIVAGLLSGVGNFILGCFSGAGTWLVNAGRSIINGLLDGLRSAFDGVKHFVSGIGDWIVKHKGPLSYDRRMLIPAGHAIMGGFNQALQDGWEDVQRTIGGMNADITGSVGVSKTGRANVTDMSGMSGGVTNIEQNIWYPAIAPTSISTQQKLQTEAMPQW